MVWLVWFGVVWYPLFAFVRLELIDPLADAAVFGDANLTFSMKLAKHRKAEIAP